MAAAHKAITENRPTSGSCIVDAAPVPGRTEAIEGEAGPGGVAVASIVLPAAVSVAPSVGAM